MFSMRQGMGRGGHGLAPFKQDYGPVPSVAISKTESFDGTLAA